MTTNPISAREASRHDDGRFGTQPRDEVTDLRLVADTTTDEDAARIAELRSAFMGDDYRTPAQAIEGRWSSNPRPPHEPIIGIPLDAKVVLGTQQDMAVCPLCEGAGSVYAGDQIECYLCEGEQEVSVHVADEFVADVKKSYSRRPSSEPDFEEIVAGRMESRGAHAVEAAEYGGMNFP